MGFADRQSKLLRRSLGTSAGARSSPCPDRRRRLDPHFQLGLDQRPLFNPQLRTVFSHATFSSDNVVLGF